MIFADGRCRRFSATSSAITTTSLISPIVITDLLLNLIMPYNPIAKLFWSLLLLLGGLSQVSSISQHLLPPTIQVVMLVHPYNKALYLPYVLGALEAQLYPKDRLRVHLITERIFYEESYFESLGTAAAASHLDGDAHFEVLDERIRANDESIEMLRRWARHQRPLYNGLELTVSNVRLSERLFGGVGVGGKYWTTDRYKLLIDSKNQELYSAFTSWCDFVLFLDADVVLSEPYTLANLTALFEGDDNEERVVVAPLLHSTGTYSNFWGGMDGKGYYLRTDDYLPILERKGEQNLGTFPVAMVNTAVLIDARKRRSRRLTFDPTEVEVGADGSTIPYDDIIAFAKSAQAADISLYIDNRHVYGYIPPPLSSDSGKEDDQQRATLLELQLDSLVEGSGEQWPVASTLHAYLQPGVHEGEDERLGVDAVYVINLRRRPERRRRMTSTLQLLNIRATFWEATDGKTLSEEYLGRQGISSLEGYLDPYHQRPMTYGEIGCFLSHYRIWEEALRRNHSAVIVLEDDVRFERNFRARWATAWARFQALPERYDFLYLGRKLNGDPASEQTIDDSATFVRPGYSYWTIGYLVTRSGLEKLLNASPLGRLIPVDEYLPLLYGSHPNRTLAEQYSGGGTDRRVQPLNALSLRQLLLSPTHYVGDAQYISDTEHSNLLMANSAKNQPNEMMEEEEEEGEEEKWRAVSGGELVQPPPQHLEL